MLIWGFFWGALLGAMWPESGEDAILLGAFLGLLAGWSLRWGIRLEMAKALVSKPGVQAPAAGLPAPAALQTTLPAQTSIAASAADNERQPAAPVPISASPPPVQPPKPQVPRPPNPLELAFGAAKTWLLGGNTIVRVGLVILFIGLSFLASYAAALGFFPVEFRLAFIGTVGIALLAFGFRQRSAKPGFSLALQGAGVAVLYLTIFAAYRLYGLVPALPAFALMIVVCGLGCALALLQNSRALAVAAFAGGFAVPVLLSTGQGNHVVLFGYYTVLNLAILFIAHQRSWRLLNVLGFLATFVVAGSWGVLKYQPEQYASTQPFLIGFVLIYIATAVLYARNTPTRLGNAVDSTLVFGTPLVGFGLQAGLVQHFYLGTAFSALGFAAVYLLLAMVLQRRAQSSYRLLVECFIALGVGFATLAVPLGLDARWTSAVWALEGAAAFWVGMRQARWMPRAFGLLLQGIATLAFLEMLDETPLSTLPLLNPAFIGAMLLALPALMIAWWLRQPLAHSESAAAKVYSQVEGRLAQPVYLVGFVWWCVAWVLEITRAVPSLDSIQTVDVLSTSTQQLLITLALVASAALSLWLGLRKQWPVATWPSRLTLLVLALGLLAQIGDGHSVLYWPAWLVWPLLLALHYTMLRTNDQRAPSAWLQKFNHAVHAGSVWLLALLLADMLWFAIGQGDLWRTSWASVVMLFSAIAMLMALVLWAGRANRAGTAQQLGWPLKNHASAYYWSAALPLAALVFLGALALALLSAGRTEPLPYIPLLNPTELAIALAIGALVLWRRVVLGAQPQPPKAQWLQGRKAVVALAGLAFVALNTVWLRIAHHFFAVPWDVGALFDSFVVQTGYAILWSLLALALMLIAHRRQLRPLWLVGAGLLGLVVVKLVLIDLANAGGVERIVAFIAVGVLMLVVGYFVPLPPKPESEPEPKPEPEPEPEPEKSL